MAHTPKEPRGTLRPEVVTFLVLGSFFVLMTVVYMWVAELEPIGSTVFALLAAMSYMISGYLWLVSRRIPARWEDRPAAEIAESAGEIGVFSPTSWWPLIAGIGATLVFLGVAIGWWLLVPGIAIGALGVIGLVMEFSSGHYAH